MNEKAITIVLEYLDGSYGEIKGSEIAGGYEPAAASILQSYIIHLVKTQTAKLLPKFTMQRKLIWDSK